MLRLNVVYVSFLFMGGFMNSAQQQRRNRDAKHVTLRSEAIKQESINKETLLLILLEGYNNCNKRESSSNVGILVFGTNQTSSTRADEEEVYKLASEGLTINIELSFLSNCANSLLFAEGIIFPLLRQGVFDEAEEKGNDNREL